MKYEPCSITPCSRYNNNCYSCYYADQCNNWLDIAPYDAYKEYHHVHHMALCHGRHDIPQADDGSIFEEPITDPSDTRRLQFLATKRLRTAEVKYLRLYVTGLTVALIATLNACKTLGIEVFLMFYNTETGDYYEYNLK